MPTFSPPVVNDVPGTYFNGDGSKLADRLFRYFGPNPRGRSVLKIAGTYRTIDTPTQDQVDTATEYYAGGHVYSVSQTVADALTAAGYTVS